MLTKLIPEECPDIHSSYTVSTHSSHRTSLYTAAILRCIFVLVSCIVSTETGIDSTEVSSTIPEILTSALISSRTDMMLTPRAVETVEALQKLLRKI